MKSINLVLSGGGIKGVAHIGALKYLEENNYKLNAVSGCSSGSIMAVLIAVGYSSSQIYNLVKYYINIVSNNKLRLGIQSIFGLNRKMGLNNGNIIENIMNNVLKEKNITNLAEIKIPIYIPTVDINTGKLIYFTNQKNYKRKYDNNIEYIYDGKIAEIVRASCSYPGIFAPKKYDKYLLIDGGIRENTPVTPLINISKDNTLAIIFSNSKKVQINNIFEVITQSFDILSHDNNYESAKMAEKILEIELNNVKLLDFSKLEYVYNEGYKQSKEKLKYLI